MAYQIGRQSQKAAITQKAKGDAPNMRHDPSTEEIKYRIHNDLNPTRASVTRHADCPSVGTETLADVSAKGATTANEQGS